MPPDAVAAAAAAAPAAAPAATAPPPAAAAPPSHSAGRCVTCHGTTHTTARPPAGRLGRRS